MKSVKLDVTQSEKEMLCSIGAVAVENESGTVTFTYPTYLSMQEIMNYLEDAIARQESDSGDWLRAKEWREAKPGLHTKIRKAFMGVVANG